MHLVRRPLLITADPLLLDDLLRLAAAAGVETEVAHEVTTARRAWTQAPLVVVGSDLADALVDQGTPRRDGVLLVGQDIDDVEVWRRGIELGAEQVLVLPAGESWLVGRIADSVETGRADAFTVSVVGGRGGAGASTLAAALAVTGVRRGLRTILVDGDPLGGGLDLLLGGEDAAGMRWPDLAGARGRVSGAALFAALPQVHQLTVLSWDRGDALTIPAEAMRSVISAAGRGSQLVVVDLPRRPDPAAEEALARSTLTVLVVPAEVRATASAGRVATAVGLVAPDVRVVVRGPAPAGLAARSVAESLALPLLGEMKAQRGLAAALERGEPPARNGRGPLARLCARILDDLPAHGREVAA